MKTMKKLSVLMVALFGLMLSVWAGDETCQQLPVAWHGILRVTVGDETCQQLSREEFRARQQAFLTEKAGLTREEAAKFFPLYFEMEDRKQKLNDDVWKLLRQGKNENMTESQYGEILEGLYNARVASSELEQTYLKKFQKILSNKKIYLIQRAEMRFHRELLEGMHGMKNGGKRPAPRR